MKTKKLPNEKSSGGKGRLTDAAILQIQKYYGLAIRINFKNVEDMHKAVWADFFHILSSNEDPQHALCPVDDGTWCKYQQTIKENENYDHNKHFHLLFPLDVMTYIKPIFRDLSDKKLLRKCLKGKTQNPNESLNNIIWNHIPKSIFVGLRTLKLGVCMAVTSFNDGGVGICKILQSCGLKPGNHVFNAMEKLNMLRVRKAEKGIEELEKKDRQHKSLLKRKLEDTFEEEEGEEKSYAPGCY